MYTPLKPTSIKHYENLPMQHTEIFKVVKNENFQKKKKIDIFLIFAQTIDCGYAIGEAVLSSTHNLCFGAKTKKNRYTPEYPSLLI